MRQIAASLWFALHSAGQNFRRNLGVSLAGVFTMGLIIFLVGGGLLFTHSVDTVLQSQEQNASHLKIYLSDNASLAAITNFESRLKSDPRVISVSFESKDQAEAAGVAEPRHLAGAQRARQQPAARVAQSRRAQADRSEPVQRDGRRRRRSSTRPRRPTTTPTSSPSSMR